MFHKESYKSIKFQGQSDLDGQGKGHQFSNPSKTFRCSINSWKVKFKMVKFLKLKAKFGFFQGHFDLNDQDQNHQISNLSETFM